MEKFFNSAVNLGFAFGAFELIMMIISWLFIALLLKTVKKIISASDHLGKQMTELAANKIKIEELVDLRVGQILKELGHNINHKQ